MVGFCAVVITPSAVISVNVIPSVLTPKVNLLTFDSIVGACPDEPSVANVGLAIPVNCASGTLGTLTVITVESASVNLTV